MTNSAGPLVSVIIPAYNAERWIRETLASATSQTWKHVEIVVVNDGSSDRTEMLARSSGDTRVSVVTQENAGAAAARNRGLHESRGGMIQFLDADDLLAPDKIERQMEALRSIGNDAIASCPWGRFTASVDTADFRHEAVWEISDPAAWLVRSFAGGGMMQPAAWLTPRSILDAAGPWNEALTLHDDGEYFTRVLLRSRQNVFVPLARVYYRDVQESLSRRRGRSAIESAFAVCRARAQHLLAVRSDVEARRALATQYAQFAYEYMTSAGDLANDALREIRLLDARPHAIAGGLPFKALTMLAGFDTALQNASNPVRVTDALAKRHIAYVTDLERRRAGGGSYSVNWHASHQLEKRFKLSYAGPLTPQPARVEDSISKLRRHVLKRPGKFAYFSGATLDRNAQMVSARLTGNPDGIVFRSGARWCRCRPRVPYFVYLDAVFHTFFFNTFDPALFDRSDLQRIWREEAAFLENASAVFFESEWGLAKARDAYGLRGNHYFSPGRGGAIDPPDADVWEATSTSLITVAMNFRQKGGDIVMNAFRQLSPRFPRLVWHVIGAPPEDLSQTSSIVHEGVLDPDDTGGLARLRHLLSQAFLIVHPTREDTSPLVLTEAAYFGCPAVSVNRFAISELVTDGDTGILVDYPASASAIAEAIARLLDDRPAYLAMRRRARERALEKYSWDAIGGFMCDRIAEHLKT